MKKKKEIIGGYEHLQVWPKTHKKVMSLSRQTLIPMTEMVDKVFEKMKYRDIVELYRDKENA